MRKRRGVFVLIFAAFVSLVQLYSCKEKYTPVTNDINPNYLVVEGLINTGTDSTIFALSRTFKLDKKATVAPEKGAIVQVESDAGATYILPELVKSGNYGRPALNLDKTRKHRLRIRTKDNREYLSDFVESKQSPPVDTVTYDFKGDRFNIYAASHDPSGKSRYYKYHYTETWQYTAGMLSLFKIENHKILDRHFPEDDIFNCWKSAASANIALGTTEYLTEDRMTDVRVNSVAPSSFKIRIGYSILVQQTVLTKEAFMFWQALQKNTESVGSIFDAQPSELKGNIHATNNPDEVVLGYVSAGTVTTKRLTLSTYQMVPNWRQWPEIDSLTLCDSAHTGLPGRNFDYTSPVGRNDIQIYLLNPDKSKYLLINGRYLGGELISIFGTTRWQCADCRLQGGVNKKPPYWY